MEKFMCLGDCATCQLVLDEPDYDVLSCAAIMTQSRTKRIGAKVEQLETTLKQIIAAIDAMNIVPKKKTPTVIDEPLKLNDNV